MPEEIAAYYKLCEVSITETEAKNLHKYTEGWISALYLMIHDHKKKDGFISTADIYKLVEAAVYKPFHKDIKNFLIMMCPFDGFTIEQAIYIWGSDNAEKLISEVISKNAFINYDTINKIYHMHNIFTDFLKDKLVTAKFRNDIYSRAAQWFMKKHDYLSAMHYFYLCDNFEGLLSALAEDKANSFDQENNELLIKYMEECPNHTKIKNHIALPTYAMHLFSFNNIDLFNKTCTEFVNNIENDKGLDINSKKELLGEYELILSFTVYNDIRRMPEHHQRACQLLNHKTLIYDTKNN